MGLLELAEKAVVVAPDATVADTVIMMSKEKVAVAVVVDAGKISGVLTTKQIQRRAAELGPAGARSPVRDAMLGPVQTIPASTSVLEAAQTMRSAKIQTLGLTDQQGSYVGLVSLRRVLYEVMDELDLKVDNLERELMADGPGG